MSKVKQQNIVRVELGCPERVTEKPAYDDNKPINFDPPQEAAVKALQRPGHVILNAPTGFGKSLIVACICLYRLVRNPQLKCVISVPQTVIARGFTKNRIFRVLNRIEKWTGMWNLCGGRGTDRVRDLLAFLAESPHPRLMGRVIICSHSALAAVHAKLRKKKCMRWFKNTMVWIDEAHHVMNAQTIGRKDIRSNRLGGLVMYLVRHASLKAQVGLVTATFMRSDMLHIVPEQIVERFTRYNVPYDVYFGMMTVPLTFEFNILLGKDTDAVRAVFKKRNCPTIIYLAKRNSRCSTPCKYIETNQILKSLEKAFRVKARLDGDVIRLGDLVVLDLVTEAGRQRRKMYLEDEKNPLDIIIALNMCQEGFDWPKAERSIIIGERHSVPELIQMIGRLFRQSEGKRHAEVFQILPAVVRDTGKFQQDRNRYFNVILAAMLLEKVFVPQEFSGQRRSGSGRSSGLTLASIIPDTDAWQRLYRDFHNTIKDGMSYKDTQPHVAPLLERHGIAEEYHKFVFDRLWGMGAMLTLRMRGKPITNAMTLDILKQISPTEGMFTLASGLLGLHTMEAVRETFGRDTLTPEQWVPIAEDLARRNAAGLLEGA